MTQFANPDGAVASEARSASALRTYGFLLFSILLTLLVLLANVDGDSIRDAGLILQLQIPGRSPLERRKLVEGLRRINRLSQPTLIRLLSDDPEVADAAFDRLYTSGLSPSASEVEQWLCDSRPRLAELAQLLTTEENLNKIPLDRLATIFRNERLSEGQRLAALNLAARHSDRAGAFEVLRSEFMAGGVTARYALDRLIFHFRGRVAEIYLDRLRRCQSIDQRNQVLSELDAKSVDLFGPIPLFNNQQSEELRNIARDAIYQDSKLFLPALTIFYDCLQSTGSDPGPAIAELTETANIPILIASLADEESYKSIHSLSLSFKERRGHFLRAVLEQPSLAPYNGYVIAALRGFELREIIASEDRNLARRNGALIATRTLLRQGDLEASELQETLDLILEARARFSDPQKDDDGEALIHDLAQDLKSYAFKRFKLKLRQNDSD